MIKTKDMIVFFVMFGIISTALAATNSIPNVTNINITNITDTTAKIAFNVNQSNAKTIIHYGASANNLNKLSDWNNRTAPRREIILDGLLKKTKYYFSIYAYNGSKFSKSSTNSFTTTETINISYPTSPKITNIGIGNISNTSAEIMFIVNQTDADTIIRYGTNQASLNKVSNWNNNTGTTRNIILSNLLNKTKYYFSINAYNGTDSVYYTSSPTRNFTTLETNNTNNSNNTGAIPNIINQLPPGQIVHTPENQSITFNVTFDQFVNVTWKINGMTVKDTEKLVRSAYYFNNSSVIGTWNVTVIGSNRNGTDSYSWTWIVDPKTYETGNRIWDGTKGMSATYTWNSYSFGGFYYDLNRDQGTERITIKDIDRSIGTGDITYETSPIEVYFSHSKFGKYQVIGFMADKYFAGYTRNSSIAENREISTLASSQLHKVLIDDDTKRTISVGGTLSLKEGYVLKMKEIDVGAGTRQIWISLLKDGGEVDDAVISAGDTYVYSKRIGSVDDFPIIAIRFDTVFRGTELNAAFIKGLFQISDSYTDIDSGSRYGKMEVSEVSRDKITMENRETVGLSEGDTIDLMGNLRITVADNSTLRFGLSVDRSGMTGTFDARGTIYPVASEWTPLNFGLDVGGKTVGFYYNIDEDIGTEKLKIKNMNGRSIQEGGLIYSTSPQEVSFDYSNFGKYSVIGFMADKYFAGYTTNTKPPNPSTSIEAINVMSQGQLHKILIDDKDKRTISVGSTLTLKDGYVLKAKDIDMSARSMLLTLLKDGSEVDSTPLSAGQTYVYTKKVGSVDDLPLVIVRFDSVFSGTEMQAAFIKGIFQISDSYTEVKNGNTYGKMEISDVGNNQIAMKNKDDISLSSGSTIDLMGNIKFRVADSSNVRFYPFVSVTPDMVTNQLVINAPVKATAGDIINIKVTAGGEPIEGVSISVEPEVGLIDIKTNNEGMVNFTLPIILKGRYNILATKIGYEKANKSIDIDKYIENKLDINAPAKADQFETISIQVKSNNMPIGSVVTTYDNDTIGLTDNKGIINYTLQSSGSHTISVSKERYITATTDIYVRAPFSEFKSLDINIVPNATFENEKVSIKSNITNIGTKTDTKSVELTVDDVVVYNKSITIFPKETKEINFVYKVLVKGNYTMTILGQTGQLEVREKPLNILLIVGIITIIGVVIIYLLTKEKDLNNILRKLRKLKK